MNEKETGSVLAEVRRIGIVPVVQLDDSDDAIPLADALKSGRLPMAEVTFRTDAAEESIARISAQCSDFTVGAGTVVNVGQAKRAIDAGAAFVVCPGLNKQVIEYCLGRDIPVIPGVVTPTEIMSALELGVRVVKYFPANLFGGISGINSLASVFRDVDFMPTGGVNIANLGEFLAHQRVAACGGTWMVKPELIAAGDFERVSVLSEEAVAVAAAQREKEF